MEKHLGQDIAKLGFGFMRLPTKNGEIDIDHVNQMVDAFIAAGFTYFDTAFGYMSGKSEDTIRQTVVERNPREAFQLATKLPLWEIKDKDSAPRIFDTQLKRTNAGYFDYYMLHGLSGSRVPMVDEFDLWGFIREKKEKGLVRHIGFSYHDNADVLDQVLTEHPEIEFVQLQINYADWEDDDVQSRLCYETAVKHGVPVIIMEPVKGGALAALRDDARALFKAAAPDQSPASWAMRFCGSLPNIITILSGMSTNEQMEDNIRTMSSLKPLTDADRQVIDRVMEILAAIPTIPCTDCKYCTENCPSNIPIPSIIHVMNDRRIYNHDNRGSYHFVTGGKGKASDCIACGVCVDRCPQRLPIVDILKECATVFGG